MPNNIDHLDGRVNRRLTSLTDRLTHLWIGIGQCVLKDQMAVSNEFSRVSVSARYLNQFRLHVIETDRCLDNTFVVLDESTV